MAEGVVLARVPPCGLLNLRGPAGPGLVEAVARTVGVALPTVPCTYTAHENAVAYWLGPDEWLLAVAAGAERGVEDRLLADLPGAVSVVDVSAGFVRYNLAGREAGTVLMKASPYDFDGCVFGSGRCVRTVFAKTGALVARSDDGSFDLFIRRSYADYFERWTADASSEDGFKLR